MTILRSSFALIGMAVLTTIASAAPVNLRCEYRTNPLGIDQTAPRLSWRSDSTERNWKQSAYEILVASSAQKLAAGDADVWDSGRTNSDDSINIPYRGPALQSRRRYYWKVRVWDAAAEVSEPAKPAWWEMGLLEPSDWKAKWITWNDPEAQADRDEMRWIWIKGQDAFAVAPLSSATFQLNLDLREKPLDGSLLLAVHGSFVAAVNGHEVGSKNNWRTFDLRDITDQLVVGKNLVEIKVIAPGEPESSNPAAKTTKVALAALVKIRRSNGSLLRIPTGSRWKVIAGGNPQPQQVSVIGDLSDSRIGDPGPMPGRAAYLRKEVTVSKGVQSARLYVTALGSYRVYLNGNRVGKDILAPGFTDYRKRVQYQTYDVTDLLHKGDNTLGALLGDGWYGSPLTWIGMHFFTPPLRFLAQLEVEFDDGTRQTFLSDDSWKAAASPIVVSTIYDGEMYDARLESAGWQKPGFDDARWSQATVAPAPRAALSAQMDASPEIIDTMKPVHMDRRADGSYIFDMGQNMVGWARLKVNGPAGSRVRLRFAEILNPDGSIYTANLRNAEATDTYVLRGGGEETFAPHFTFHGFRYVEMTGYPGTPTLDSIEGDVVSSVRGKPVLELNTSSDLVNRMWSIGIWGQRGNFLSIPTDCPQRDERLGWMGDAGVFWRTGTYNFDVAAFSQKFMQDIDDAQIEGAFSNVSPNTLPRGNGAMFDPGVWTLDMVGAPGWGDAGVIVPWTTWIQYGDTAIIQRHWDAMQRWMDFIQSRNPDFLRKHGVGPNFADWLAPDPNTNKDLLATAYWALIADMMSQMAHAIGNEADAKKYQDLLQNIRAAFQKAYIKDDGQVGTGTQTSYVVALYTKMAPESLEPKLVEKLVRDIEARHWHLSTGFLGTPFLLFTLANHGRVDVAYRLLLNDTYPSWGYMLSKGATTWWERWNGDTGDPAMNSYNHYAFGSVMAWVYRYAAGIDATAEAPGFKEIMIHPRLDSRLTSGRTEYDSVYGKIVSDWHGTPAGPFSLRVTIPANTSAKVFLPAITGSQIMEDGKSVTAARQDGEYVLQIGSGSYDFEVK
ncbi:MAG: family 78 glycoside hydrolase catalytic domain [Candidatus Sulfotelmatobacter sp.]